MRRYIVTWTEEKSETIVAPDIKAAAASAIKELGLAITSANSKRKLLSVYESPPPPPTPPAPTPPAPTPPAPKTPTKSKQLSIRLPFQYR